MILSSLIACVVLLWVSSEIVTVSERAFFSQARDFSITANRRHFVCSDRYFTNKLNNQTSKEYNVKTLGIIC